ncbi:Crp/Fnr family transcriptional regulator [Sphingomonas elodea]|uniref:Crp/Fnr family transcriptional regulator n=1 Tax=Sphingomonas elodea TaxID=179878 RepID=UPI0002630923|nr:Crp/Fnr family transcriptional regulator [Sphingomonas elodea]
MLNHPPHVGAAPISRLGAFASLSEDERRALRLASEIPHRLAASRDLFHAGQRTGGSLIVLDGWLGRVKLFSDGRRQILSFLLPGDVIQEPRTFQPVAVSTITALCDTILCPAPAAEDEGLREAYAVSAALDEANLMRQIARLGRMSAYERIHDWLFEMHERLMLAGRAGPDSFAMPLTQETLADALGLTSVHVNRTLQSMRRDNVLEWRGGVIRLKHKGASARATGQRGAIGTAHVPAGTAPLR